MQDRAEHYWPAYRPSRRRETIAQHCPMPALGPRAGCKSAATPALAKDDVQSSGRTLALRAHCRSQRKRPGISCRSLASTCLVHCAWQKVSYISKCGTAVENASAMPVLRPNPDRCVKLQIFSIDVRIHGIAVCGCEFMLRWSYKENQRVFVDSLRHKCDRLGTARYGPYLHRSIRFSHDITRSCLRH